LCATLSLLLACSGDGAPSATTPAATATSVSTPLDGQASGCPVSRDTCEFAASVSRSLQSGAIDGLVAAARLTEYTCPATRPQGLGGPYPGLLPK
jgi:hypothetical protein